MVIFGLLDCLWPQYNQRPLPRKFITEDEKSEELRDWSQDLTKEWREYSR